MSDDLVNWLQEYADAVAHYERGDDAILIDLARTRIKALTAENERLRGYATHDDECAINGWLPRGPDFPCPPCSCGLSQALGNTQ
jgi:hypothetical protein